MAIPIPDDVVRENNIDFLQCEHDQYRPWSIVCVHLLDHSSREWVPMDSANPYVEHDWLCPACSDRFDRGESEQMLDVLLPVCVDCVDRERRQFDPNYFK